MLTLLGILVSGSCIYASARRLWFASDATSLDPVALGKALRSRRGEGALGSEGELRAEPAPSAVWPRLRQEVENEPAADWERDLFAAIASPAGARVALVNEQLAELDYRAHRWARVPRVCASISSSSGFLLAALAMRAALASDDLDIDAAILSAINVVTIGLAGAAFCAATHMRARTMTRDRLAAADALIDRLEAVATASERARSAGHPPDAPEGKDGSWSG